MNKKNMLIGVVFGLVANALGLFLATKILGQGDGFLKVLEAANAEGFLGKLVSLGAVLNLIVFFYFIKKKQDFRARGVLLATMLTALLTFIIKF
jgi:hypothetical protein